MELLKYFGSESEMLSHCSRLMVAPEHDHLSRVVQFKAEQKHAHLQRKNSPVNVVAQEKEICPTMKVKHKIDIQTQKYIKAKLEFQTKKCKLTLGCLSGRQLSQTCGSCHRIVRGCHR